MKTLTLTQEFDIAIYESDEWEFGIHKHHFFEIIYIISGSGHHLINENHFSYKPGSVFLITPNDNHAFEINTTTVFCILTFNTIYFSVSQPFSVGIDFSEWFKKLEIIFYNASYIEGEAITNEEDQIFISSLICRVIDESKNKDLFHETITKTAVFLILSVIARNIQQQLHALLKNKHPNSEIGAILFYIQQHIYDKEKLKLDALADTFFKSKNYISHYFKQHTGQSIKNYCILYKLNLLKNRLYYSDYTMAQIANELGFNDESHLNKIFKSRFGMTAKEFKDAKNKD